MQSSSKDNSADMQMNIYNQFGGLELNKIQSGQNNPKL